MIARLRGRLAHKSPEALVVDVNGVGYEVFVSLNTYYALPEEGSEVQLEVQTQVRENAMELFGFANRLEKAVFGLLLNVSGVGPRMAQGVLSGIQAGELLDVIGAGDLRRLVAVPGIGKKRAERLVVELRDRVQDIRARFPGDGKVRSRLEDEAASALVNLGYKQAEAEHAIEESVAQAGGELEKLIRLALKRLSA